MLIVSGWVRAQSITVTSPNGGETWSGSSTQDISWTVNNIPSVDIEYTTNNGSSWHLIVAAHPGLSSPYPWQVPSAGPSGSNQCRVRIKSATNNSIQDESNSNFTIPASVITLNYPLGGENLKAGQMRAIRWTPLSVVTVRIEYSTNSGSNWTTVVDSVPANRMFYSWLIPNPISGTVRVRVSDRSHSVVNSVSPADFSISALPGAASGKYFGGAYDGYAADNNLPKILTVNTPNGGETWSGATVQNITWSSSNVDNIRIEFTTNNGSIWHAIEQTYPAATGTYSWLVPSAGPLGSTQCLIRLTNVLDTTLADVSNAHFSIPPSTVTLVTPNGGENYKAGTMTSIRWSSASILAIQLHYSTNNGSNWILMADSIPAWRTYYGWTIPTGIQSTQCLVRARNKQDTVV